MSRKSGCGLMLIAAIVLAFAGGLLFLSGRGRLAGHPDGSPPSPQRAPMGG